MNKTVGWGDLTQYECLKCHKLSSVVTIRLCGFCNYGTKRDLIKYAYCHGCIKIHEEEMHGPVNLV